MPLRETALTVIVVPEDGGASRTFRVGRRRLRRLKVGTAALLVLLTVGLVSWPVLAVRSWQAERLEARVAELEGERTQVAALAAALEELEGRYERLRSMFGSDQPLPSSGLWLPPPASGGTGVGSADADALPGAWPLADRGFVTQSLLEEGSGQQHPGVDIAVPAHTYVRAAGAGTVAEIGDDPIYGIYVALDHGQGYSSLYAHTAEAFVSPGQTVRRGEVIALSGNTGRSTAPHLHFEILQDGAPVDPLRLVRPPS